MVEWLDLHLDKLPAPDARFLGWVHWFPRATDSRKLWMKELIEVMDRSLVHMRTASSKNVAIPRSADPPLKGSRRWGAISVYTIVVSGHRPLSYPPPGRSIAPRTPLGCPELAHLLRSLLKLLVLAFLVAMSLVLDGGTYQAPVLSRGTTGQACTYDAFPRQIVVVETTFVEGDEEVGATVAICQGEFCIPHLLAGCRCCRMEESVNRRLHARVGRLGDAADAGAARPSFEPWRRREGGRLGGRRMCRQAAEVSSSWGFASMCLEARLDRVAGWRTTMRSKGMEWPMLPEWQR